jgi:hypothetical protein
MKRSLRSSSSALSVSTGSIATNFEGSNSMWRSSSGRMPRPIDPNPISTIGPSNFA